jgi:hypothetical protein
MANRSATEVPAIETSPAASAGFPQFQHWRGPRSRAGTRLLLVPSENPPVEFMCQLALDASGCPVGVPVVPCVDREDLAYVTPNGSALTGDDARVLVSEPLDGHGDCAGG